MSKTPREHLHLSVAAIVVWQDRFLFVEEFDKHTGQRVLNQPAGHMEADEDIVTAACRELFEETGLHLTPCAWLGVSQLIAQNNHRYVRFNLLFTPTALPMHFQPQDPDIQALHWFSKVELAQQQIPLRSQLVMDSVDRYLTGQQLCLSWLGQTVHAVPSTQMVL